MKNVLMIAYHYPPQSGGSGRHRTISFVKDLHESGWSPIILTVQQYAYARISHEAEEFTKNFKVIRVPAWDAARHFSIRHRYPGWIARPDRWISWWFGAVIVGWLAMRSHRPDVIWSTYPIATAHKIGFSLSKYSGVPWVADFRDPMAQDDYPTDPAQWRSFLNIERATIESAAMSVFTTPGAAALYRLRYPKHAGRITVIENGYDEDDLPDAQMSSPLNPGRLTLLHSGIVYPSERDPSHLMTAVAILKRDWPDLFHRFVLRFRAPVHGGRLADLATRWGVMQAIEILPPVPHREALAEMRAADGLLLLQASNCNQQIPAKFYEYLACRRPLLGLTDPNGDTAQAMRNAGLEDIAPLDDVGAILALLRRFITAPESIVRPKESVIVRASRRARTAQLAALLDQVSGTS